MRKILSTSIVAGLLAMGGIGLAPAASRAAGLPPIFTEHSPQSVIIDLNAGQNSFESTGTAIDLDPEDTVYFLDFGRPSFITFEATSGNPGTFRLHAENLTGADYGGYFVTVAASDSPTNFNNGNALSFAIGIVPEPTFLGVFILSVPLLQRRR